MNNGHTRRKGYEIFGEPVIVLPPRELFASVNDYQQIARMYLGYRGFGKPGQGIVLKTANKLDFTLIPPTWVVKYNFINRIKVLAAKFRNLVTG